MANPIGAFNLIGGYIEGMEDKILGYMVGFTVSDKLFVDVVWFNNLLVKYGLDEVIDYLKQTPELAFKRCLDELKGRREMVKVKYNGKEVEVIAEYDIATHGKYAYLIRRIKIETAEIRSDMDSERLARIYLDKKGKVRVEPLTVHIGDMKYILSDEDVEKLREYIEELKDKYLHNYIGKRIRGLIRDKILRDKCYAIPFTVAKGGVWMVLNKEDRIQILSGIKGVIDDMRRMGYRIDMIVLPLFDSEDVRRKIKEDIEREALARYKDMLMKTLRTIMRTKDGEVIMQAIENLLQEEDGIRKLLEDYAEILKDRLRIELEGLEDIKQEMVNAVMSKIKKEKIELDSEKVKMMIEAIGIYRNDDMGVETIPLESEKEVEKTPIDDILLDKKRIGMVLERLKVDMAVAKQKKKGRRS